MQWRIQDLDQAHIFLGSKNLTGSWGVKEFCTWAKLLGLTLIFTFTGYLKQV